MAGVHDHEGPNPLRIFSARRTFALASSVFLESVWASWRQSSGLMEFVAAAHYAGFNVSAHVSVKAYFLQQSLTYLMQVYINI